MSTNPQEGSQPSVVLVHGGFAESASCNGVIRRLQDRRLHGDRRGEPSLRSVSGRRANVSPASSSRSRVRSFWYGRAPTAALSSAMPALGIGQRQRHLVFVAAFAPEAA